VPDDIPLAGAAGTVTGQPVAADSAATVAAGVDEAVADRWWEVYFACVALAVGAFLTWLALFGPGRPALIAVGVLGVMVVWYAVLGHRVVCETRGSWRGWVFHAGQLPLYVTGLLLADAVSLLLFAICPMVYMTVPLRPGHFVAATYAFAPAAIAGVTGHVDDLPVLIPLGAVVTGMSMAISITMARNERISEERAALIRELNASRAEVARLSREAGIAEERQRLAGDIHDTVAQGLSSVVMLVEAADAALPHDPQQARSHLSLAARAARENLDETRAIVAALTPSHLAQATLADALARLADRFERETGTGATLSTTGEARPLPTGTEVVLLRVVQEALNNVRKHAGASTVAIGLAYGTDAVTVDIRDDGVGFDVAALAPGYGLGGMQSRVEQVGGRLGIASTPGAGTTIRTEVPA
jgi:signal transduction histidine kinase